MGSENPLTFRCTGCGHCCRQLRVAVTSFDLRRLTRSSGKRTLDVVQWLSPEEVDMTGEPGGFVHLSDGRRLMVLAQQSEACVFLDAGNRCTVYTARPMDCRAFPFDFERGDVRVEGEAAEPSLEGTAPTQHGARTRLKLLPLEGCDYALDGHQTLSDLAATDRTRFEELRQYHSLLLRWNRLAKHRARLGKRVGSAEAFLSFVERSWQGPSADAGAL
ncbi:MAG: putative zinc- or iron-chelating domain [Pseudomonadota bacterium]